MEPGKTGPIQTASGKEQGEGNRLEGNEIDCKLSGNNFDAGVREQKYILLFLSK